MHVIQDPISQCSDDSFSVASLELVFIRFSYTVLAFAQLLLVKKQKMQDKQEK